LEEVAKTSGRFKNDPMPTSSAWRPVRQQAVPFSQAVLPTGRKFGCITQKVRYKIAVDWRESWGRIQKMAQKGAEFFKKLHINSLFTYFSLALFEKFGLLSIKC
jgi:hypothetical protein